MNYWDYIKVEELLALQTGAYDDPAKVSDDETLFIVSHQIYELWFKLVIRELVAARNVFNQNPVPDVELAQAVRSLRRIIVIFEQAAQHFRVVETLTPRDYLEFRDRLIPASGFQSAQMREIEILLGLDDAVRIPLGREGNYREALRSQDGSASSATRRVEARRADTPSLKDAVYDWLARTPIDGASTDEAATTFVSRFASAHRSEIRRRVELAAAQALTPADVERLRARYEAEIVTAEAFLNGEEGEADSSEAAATPASAAASDVARKRRRRVRAAIVFLESYRELPRLAWPREAVDALVAMEQTILIWRQRHARMVEREIGRRTGTGGSPGVDYLDQTALRYRVFPDIWTVRGLLLRKPALPPLEHADEYRFRVED